MSNTTYAVHTVVAIDSEHFVVTAGGIDVPPVVDCSAEFVNAFRDRYLAYNYTRCWLDGVAAYDILDDQGLPLPANLRYAETLEEAHAVAWKVAYADTVALAAESEA